MQSEIPYTSANLSINGFTVPVLAAMDAGAELRGLREVEDRHSPGKTPADSETENYTDGGSTSCDVIANARGYKVLKIDGSPSLRKKKTSLTSSAKDSNGTSEARLSECLGTFEPGRRNPEVSVSSSTEDSAGQGEAGELRGVRFHPGHDGCLSQDGDGGKNSSSSLDLEGKERTLGESLGASRRARGSSPVVGQSRRRLVSSELRLPPKPPGNRKSAPGALKLSSGSQTREASPSSSSAGSLGEGVDGGPEAEGVATVSTSSLNTEEGDSDPFSSEPQLQSCLSSSEREPSSGGGKTAGRSKDPPKRRISFPAESVLTAVVQDGDIPELMRILSDPRDRVDINQESHVGLTALHYGVLSNNLDAVKILLSHGAQVNAKDVHGFSPLHTASACGFLQIVSLLVLFGADVFALTSQAELPVDLAKDVGVIRLLMLEMTRQIHEELYVPSLVTSKMKHLAVVCQRLLLLLLAHLVHMVASAWRRYKRKTE